MVVFHYNTEEKFITVAFTGRMDSLAVVKVIDILQAEPIMKEWKSDDKIVFDLQNVDYIASSFIRICVSHAKLAGPGLFSIANCQPFVKKTFKISGLDDVLNIT